MNDALKGTALGTLVTGAYWWSRNQDETDRNLRNLRADTRDLNTRFNEHLSSGDWQRLILSIVRDSITGLAVANAGTTTPSPVPTPSVVTRPDFTSGANVPTMSYPPATPSYDASGNTDRLGEMGIAFQTLTLEEFRAWAQGLAQKVPPTPDAKLQIFWAAQALSATLAGQSLSVDQYKQAWQRLFQSAGILDPHEDPALAPSATPAVPTTTITPLTSASIGGYPYANRNTDRAMRFRIVSTAGWGAGDVIGTIRFGSDYRYQDGSPYQPVVHVTSNDGPTALGYTLYPKNIGYRTFDLYAALAIGANLPVDVWISTGG